MAEDCGTCEQHGDMAIDVKSFKLIVIVFGAGISLLLIWLIGISTIADKGLQVHKLDSLERYSEIESQMKDLTGMVNLTNNNVRHLSSGVEDIKNALEIPTSNMAEASVDTSILWLPE